MPTTLLTDFLSSNFQGNIGPQGAQGSAGSPGPQGFQGPQGSAGAQGAQGFQGPQGAQGSTGAQGAAGAQGAQGFQGPQGAQGLTGPQGSVGAQGDQGITGGITVVDDTTTNATRYITFENVTSGVSTNVGVSSTKLVFNPSTGNLGVGTTIPQTKLQVDGVIGFNDTNVRIGDSTTGANLTSGSYNNFIGLGAGNSTTSGNYNNFFGNSAGYANTTGEDNNFFGYAAGYNNTTGIYNNFLGYSAGYYNTSGSRNQFIGESAGLRNTTGSYNIGLGDYALGVSTSASYKIVIGSGSYAENGPFDSPDTTKDKQLAIGIKTSGTSQYWIVGNENFNIGIGTTNPTQKLDVRGDITLGTSGINTISSTNDIRTWNYQGKFKSVTADDTSPQAVYIGAAGTALYMVGDIGNDINQYTLSTPYDVSTAGASIAAFSVATQETAPTGIDFNSTGTKMFISGQTGVAPLIASGDYVHEYSLSTAWTVSSAGYTTSYNVTQETFLTGVVFGDSGSKMYVVGSTNDTIYQYTLTTPYSLASGVSYDSKSFSVATQDTTPQDISFNSTGTVVWIIGSTSDKIYEYRLGTAWDISTAVFFGEVYVGYNEDTPTGLHVISEQNVAYIVGTNNDTVYQYNTNSYGLVLASSGIRTDSAIVLNNETRIQDDLYASGSIRSGGTLRTYGLLQADSTFATFGTTSTLNSTTSSNTINLSTAAVTSGNSKTINVGTGGAAGSRLLVTVGSATAGTASTIVVNSGTDVLIGAATSTGTASQRLQVTGGAYVSGSVGIGTTNPTQPLHIVGNALLTGNVLNSAAERFLVQASSIQVFTTGSNATYTAPANLVSALVIVTGGGGGAGGGDSDGSSGGGGAGGAAGGTAIRVYNSTELGATATYTVGAGGSGGSNVGGNGNAGGNTFFIPVGTGSSITGNGGALGTGSGTVATNSSIAGSSGGTATGGQINIEGGDGSGGGGADAGAIGIGGMGGSSFWGGGGASAVAGAASANGLNGTAYGSGGGGGAAGDNTTGGTGGNGVDGAIFVLEFTA